MDLFHPWFFLQLLFRSSMYFNDVSMTADAAAEVKKHTGNDPKCNELGWSCVPLAVESYGA